MNANPPLRLELRCFGLIWRPSGDNHFWFANIFCDRRDRRRISISQSPDYKIAQAHQFGPFILSFTLRASFSISSAFFSTSIDSMFSFDLSTYSFNSCDSLSSLSVSLLR